MGGSQDAIRRLPKLLTPSTVAIPAVGYQEHQLAWVAAGHEVLFYFTQNELQNLVIQHSVEHVVIISPNNPTTKIIEADFYVNSSFCYSFSRAICDPI
ncbi:MAG: cobalamin biosynthetic protein CobC [Cellvibrionaceae bacterium]